MKHLPTLLLIAMPWPDLWLVLRCDYHLRYDITRQIRRCESRDWSQFLIDLGACLGAGFIHSIPGSAMYAIHLVWKGLAHRTMVSVPPAAYGTN